MNRKTRERLIVCVAILAIMALLGLGIIISGTDTETLIPATSSTDIIINAKDTSVFITAEERVDIFVEQHTSRNLQIDRKGETTTINAEGKGILQLSLPSWQRIESITVSTTSGDIVIDSIMTRSLDLESMTGTMMLTAISADKLMAESDSGNIILTDTYTKLTHIENGTGYIRAIGSIGDIEAEAKAGSIYIVPTGESQIEATTDSGAINIIGGERSVYWSTSGSVVIRGEEAPSSGGDDEASIKAISGRGDITISE